MTGWINNCCCCCCCGDGGCMINGAFRSAAAVVAACCDGCTIIHGPSTRLARASETGSNEKGGDNKKRRQSERRRWRGLVRLDTVCFFLSSGLRSCWLFSPFCFVYIGRYGTCTISEEAWAKPAAVVLLSWIKVINKHGPKGTSILFCSNDS